MNVEQPAQRSGWCSSQKCFPLYGQDISFKLSVSLQSSSLHF